jgi:hypothetical protein
MEYEYANKRLNLTAGTSAALTRQGLVAQQVSLALYM